MKRFVSPGVLRWLETLETNGRMNWFIQEAPWRLVFEDFPQTELISDGKDCQTPFSNFFKEFVVWFCTWSSGNTVVTQRMLTQNNPWEQSMEDSLYLPGVIKWDPLLGESNNTDLWSFWGISLLNNELFGLGGWPPASPVARNVPMACWWSNTCRT